MIRKYFQKLEVACQNIISSTSNFRTSFCGWDKEYFYGRFEVCTKLDVAIMFFVIWGKKIYN